jgi:hypothetical protein
MRDYIGLFRLVLACAFALSLPLSADATTLKIVEVGTGNREVVKSPGVVNFNGIVGDFEIIASAGLNGPQTSLQTSGVGKLKIVVTKRIRGFSALSAELAGRTEIFDATRRVKVKYRINTGNGWENIGDVLIFRGLNGNGQEASTFDTAAIAEGKFKLRTVFRIKSTFEDQTSNIHSSLNASAPSQIPIPAAGFLLISALGALGAAARRRRR